MKGAHTGLQHAHHVGIHEESLALYFPNMVDINSYCVLGAILTAVL